MNLSDFKAKYPDLYKAVFDEGSKAGYDTGFAQGDVAGFDRGKAMAKEAAVAEGAAAERNRIKAVEDQAIPGHEALINDLKYDGKTTGEQAAVKVLQAEKALRTDVLTKLSLDAPPAVPAVEPVIKADKRPDQVLSERCSKVMSETGCTYEEAYAKVLAADPSLGGQALKSLSAE